MLKNDKVKLVVDVSIPTETILTERRPDFILHHSPSRRAFIFEVACAWEPLILEREAEKRDKYQRFAADLAGQVRCWKVTVHPLVMGDLESVCGFKKELKSTSLLDTSTISRMVREAQYEVLVSAAQIVPQQLSID